MNRPTLSAILPAVAVVVLLLDTVALCPAVDASIFDSNDVSLPSYQSADGNNITTDTLTGLDWLDIDTTTDKSFVDMSSLLGVGELADFRYATLAEADMFFRNLGLPTAPLPDDLSSPDPGSALIFAAASHTGLMNKELDNSYAFGFVSDVITSPFHTPFHPNPFFASDTAVGGVRTNTNGRVPESNDADLGSWLVRTSQTDVIPEPTSLIPLSTHAWNCHLSTGWKRFHFGRRESKA